MLSKRKKTKIKLFILMILLLLVVKIDTKEVSADISDYNAYTRINVQSGKLLREYTKDEITVLCEQKIEGRKMYGWKTAYMTKNARCNFITDVIFSVYNDGDTSVDYTINVSSETTTKTSVSGSGGISTSVKGDVKKFKLGLDESLKISADYSKTELVKNQENLVLHVDPKTICVVYIQGDGLLTNGVARYFHVFFKLFEGGFEYFTITNSYLKIEKIKI